MSGYRVFKWSLMLVIASGSLCTRTSVNAAFESSSSDTPSHSSNTQERIQQTPTYRQNVYTDEQLESTSKVIILDSDFHEEDFSEGEFPFSQRVHNLLDQKPLTREKRGSGVVIRGPFYPYPRRGHPFAFTSGGITFTLSSPSLLLIVSSFLALQQIALPCISWW